MRERGFLGEPVFVGLGQRYEALSGKTESGVWRVRRGETRSHLWKVSRKSAPERPGKEAKGGLEGCRARRTLVTAGAAVQTWLIYTVLAFGVAPHSAGKWMRSVT